MPERNASAGGPTQRVVVERLGTQGEGVALCGDQRVSVPYALPGETIRIDLEGERGTLVGVLTASADRIAPICPYFTTCGGCAVQTLAPAPYAAWKRGLLAEALGRAGVAAEVDPLVDAHGVGRRRATFHARTGPDGRPRVGFMRARAHTIVEIEACPILDPDLAGALPAARAITRALASDKPLDIVTSATTGGLDIDVRGHGPLAEPARQRLVQLALTHGLARLANHGTVVIERNKPTLPIGKAVVEVPPGAFVQATAAGEAALAQRVEAALAGAKRVADLFCGIGTFALRLAEKAEVTACDSDKPALNALDKAARATAGLRRVWIETRDLFKRPLGTDELARFDALVLDPPRAGAEAQMRAIAASRINRIVSVACDARTFARDTAILVSAGFEAERIEPIDQFRYSAHLEIVASFRRAPAKRKRRLLG